MKTPTIILNCLGKSSRKNWTGREIIDVKLRIVRKLGWSDYVPGLTMDEVTVYEHDGPPALEEVEDHF